MKLAPILAALLFLALPAIAADSERNVEIRLTITNADASGKTTERTFELLTREDRASELLTGWRVPISTTATVSAQPAMMQSFTYQNVGVTIRLNTDIGEDGRVLLDGQVEMSDVQQQESAPAHQPTIGTFQHQFEAVLDDARPVTVSRAPKYDGGSISIVVEAEIQD